MPRTLATLPSWRKTKSENVAHQEDVAVVDLCCTSNSSYDASADSKQGSSSVDMVGEVRLFIPFPLVFQNICKFSNQVQVALETSILDNQDISWCEEASQKQPDSKRLVINMLNIAHVRLFVFSFGDVELVSNECAEMNLIGNED